MARANRRASILSPSLILRRKAVRQGFLGGQRGWQIVGLIVFGRRFLRKLLGGEPELVATERLEPGQAISIRAIDPRAVDAGTGGRRAKRRR